jgi:tRNA A37 threonylcarbamoyladenosine dehydratase
VPEFFTAATADRLLATHYDFVVDAIDSLSQKCLLLAGCRDRAIPAVTIGSAGGRRDGTAVQVADLGDAEQDEMLRQLRRKLRRDYAFTRKLKLGVSCVFSPERPVFPWVDGTARSVREPDSEVSLDCSTGFGTASFVTGAFGFAAAGEVVRQLVASET